MRIAADFGSDGTRKDWIVDSGASEHFISDTGELDYVADDDPGGKVAVANGVVCPVTAIGPVTLRVKGFRPTGRAGEQRDEPIITTIRLGRVSVVPALTKRLLSVRRLFECDGVRVEFNGRDLLTLPSGYTVPLNTAEGRFRLDTESALSAVAAADSDDVRLWHERLGHFNPGRIIDALRHRGYSISRGCDLGNCTACLLNRRRKGHPDHPTNARIYTHFGERISSDLCGPFPPSPHGFTFAINFVDHYSTVIAVYFLRDPVNAEQVINAARAFMRDHAHLLVKTRVACVVDEWHCDNGTQFTSASVEEFCAVLAIQRTFSPADVHEGNAVAERAWGLLLRCTRAAIAHAGGGVKQAQFWPFLFLQFSLVHNWLDTNRGSAKSPHWVVPMQKASRTVRVFDLQRLRVVLCDCTCVIKTEERAHKLTPTRIKAIHLGYDVRRRGYFVYIPEIGRITSSNDVYFDERSFTLLGGVMSNVKLRGGIRTQNITPPAPPPTTPALPGTAPPVVVDAFVPADANAIELARRCDGAWELSDFVIGASADTSASVHYRSGTVGEVLEVSAQIGPVPIPRSAEDAVKHPLYGKSWLAAMTDDFVGKSQDNGAWELVAKLPPGKRAIKGKWVFRVFYKDDGSVDRFKARWVACGYSQRPGIDYLETYCGTLRIETLLIFLADCNANDDELERWDVVKAFTSTTKLDVEMYVEQPHGFVDPKFKACRLLKGLEGTKQGGAIFQKENTAVLKACGFEQCTADPNLFRIIFDDGGYIIAVVYVDDIFVRYQSPTKGRVDTTFARYCRSFKATRVSEPRRMVGFDIARDRPARKLRVFQTNYVCELYKKYLSSQCSKDFTTPVQSSRCPEFMAMTGATCEEDDRAVADKPFLPLMGGLNWIGWTRPDIKFYNARLCCFMHRPKIENYEAALAVLSYLYTTRDLGLEFSASSNLDGVVYCDSSYNQIPDTFYGHGVWYGGAPVASCSRVLRLGAQSSYESESFAYAGASMSLRFCQQVAVFGGGGFKMPTTIRTDSNGVVLATRNGGVTSRNRHFEKFLRLGRLHYEDNISSPEFVPTSDQCADIWTKALDKTTFLKHRAKLVR